MCLSPPACAPPLGKETECGDPPATACHALCGPSCCGSAPANGSVVWERRTPQQRPLPGVPLPRPEHREPPSSSRRLWCCAPTTACTPPNETGTSPPAEPAPMRRQRLAHLWPVTGVMARSTRTVNTPAAATCFGAAPLPQPTRHTTRLSGHQQRRSPSTQATARPPAPRHRRRLPQAEHHNLLSSSPNNGAKRTPAACTLIGHGHSNADRRTGTQRWLRLALVGCPLDVCCAR